MLSHMHSATMYTMSGLCIQRRGSHRCAMNSTSGFLPASKVTPNFSSFLSMYEEIILCSCVHKIEVSVRWSLQHSMKLHMTVSAVGVAQSF